MTIMPTMHPISSHAALAPRALDIERSKTEATSPSNPSQSTLKVILVQ